MQRFTHAAGDRRFHLRPSRILAAFVVTASLLVAPVFGCGSTTELWLNVSRGSGGGTAGDGGSPSSGGAGAMPGTGGIATCYGCAALLQGNGFVQNACTSDGPPSSSAVVANLASCACKPGVCQGPCHAFCAGEGTVRADCASCLDKPCGPEFDACDASHGTGGTGGTTGTGGVAGTGGTTGGTGGAAGGTGGIAGTGGTTGGTGGSTGGSAGTGGAPITGTACEKRHIARGTDPLLDDFEQDQLGAEPGNFGNHDGVWGGTYVYDDMTGTRSFTVVADGHVGQGANFTLSGYRLWGGGWGMWINCVDVTAYAGLSFWAKGSDGDVVQVLFGNPATMSPDNGGVCTDTNCNAAYFRIRLTPEYQRYDIHWADIRPGTAAFDPRVLTSIGWHLTNPNYGRPHDGWLTIDDVRLLTSN